MRTRTLVFGLISMLASTTLVQGQVVCWHESNGGNGNCYEYVNPGASISWNAAQPAAESRSFFGVMGHLATITSVEESDFLQSVAPDEPAFARSWVGAHYDSGQWSWITGESWSYERWCSGEPNGTPSENAIDIRPQDLEDPGCWNDEEDFMTLNSYLVEYEDTAALASIPATSQWGFTAMTLLLLTSASIMLATKSKNSTRT